VLKEQPERRIILLAHHLAVIEYCVIVCISNRSDITIFFFFFFILLTITKHMEKSLEAQLHQFWYSIDSAAIDTAPCEGHCERIDHQRPNKQPSESYLNSAPRHIPLPHPTATLLMMFSNFV